VSGELPAGVDELATEYQAATEARFGH